MQQNKARSAHSILGGKLWNVLAPVSNSRAEGLWDKGLLTVSILQTEGGGDDTMDSNYITCL